MLNSRPIPKRLALVALLLGALGAVAVPRAARAAADLLQACPEHCFSDDIRVHAEATRGVLGADEQRVVLWLVHRILSDDDDGSPRLELTESEVSEALGIKLCELDRERIRDRVRATLVRHSCQQAIERSG